MMILFVSVENHLLITPGVEPFCISLVLGIYLILIFTAAERRNYLWYHLG